LTYINVSAILYDGVENAEVSQSQFLM